MTIINDYLALPYGRTLFYERDGSFHAEILDFPGCIASGFTIEETLANLERTAEGWLMAMLSTGKPIPPPETVPFLRASIKTLEAENAALFARVEALEMYAVGVKEERDAALACAQVRIAELEDRLEVDCVWVLDPDNGDGYTRQEIPPERRADFPIDGIDARNATIELQDRLIEKLKKKISELEAEVEELNRK